MVCQLTLPLVPNPPIKPAKGEAELVLPASLLLTLSELPATLLLTLSALPDALYVQPALVPFLIKIKQESEAKALATKLKECVALL